MKFRKFLGVCAVTALAACGGADPQRNQDAPAPGDNIPGMPADGTADPAQLPAPDTLGAPGAAPAPTEPGAPGALPREPGGGMTVPPQPGGGAGGAQTRPPATGTGGAPAPAPQQPAVQPPAQQQQDEGAAMLQRASAAYAGVRSMRADFTMTYTNPLLRQTSTSRGTLFQRRPDLIALRFSDPAGDVIVGDGQYFWVYYPSVDAQQVLRQPAAASGEQGVDLQAQFVGDPVRRFQYTVHGQESVGGRPATVMTLVPRQRADYRELKVWLDARDGLARRFEITEHNNTVRRFDLTNLEVNATIPDATFRFTPPPGARTVGG
jgi:outer membrane lipoprotein carrier protein